MILFFSIAQNINETTTIVWDSNNYIILPQVNKIYDANLYDALWINNLTNCPTYFGNLMQYYVYFCVQNDHRYFIYTLCCLKELLLISFTLCNAQSIRDAKHLKHVVNMGKHRVIFESEIIADISFIFYGAVKSC